MTTVSINVTHMFFDRPKVIAAIGRMNARALSRAGAFIRRRARSSLRRRKRVSLPGEPPSVHSKDPFATLKNILFAWDPARQSVIVGPVKLNVHHFRWVGGRTGGVIAQGAVPGTLEHGGTIGFWVTKNLETGNWERISMRDRRKRARDHVLVPVWKATPAQKAAHTGVHTIRKGGRTINFYIVPQSASPTRITYVNIMPRPFMGPALAAEAPNFPSLWFNQFREAG